MSMNVVNLPFAKPATHFTAGFDYKAFRADPRTIYAVTRCLEIISELT
jgi:uncharacterized protein with HEPN domain